MTFSVDYAFQDAYDALIRETVGPHILRRGSFDDDALRCGDLRVYKADGLVIAARVRRHGYAETWPWQFTIRWRRDSGAGTEYPKLVQGFGHWFFYAHASSQGIDLDRWMIVDLDVWRSEHLQSHVVRGEKANGDGTYFRWYDARSFRGKILVNCSHMPVFETERRRVG